MTRNTPVQVAFLLSYWYSGATLLTLLLDRHPQICSNGEAFPFSIKDAGEYRCSCGEKIKSCDFYRQSASHNMYDVHTDSWNRQTFIQVPHFSDIDLVNRLFTSPRYDNASRRLLDPLLSQRFRQHQIEFYSQALRIAGANVYLDGTKSMRRVQLLAADPRLTVKCIHLVRDCRGFANSFRKNKNLADGADLTEIGKAWCDYNNLVDKFCSARPGMHLLLVRYEDLCNNLENTLVKIHRFLGTEPTRDNEDPEYQPHITGNRMRGSFDGTINLDLSWREQLNRRQLRQLAEVTGPQMVRYGFVNSPEEITA